MTGLLRACAAAAGVLVLAAALTACEDDTRPCVKSHTELTTVVMPGANDSVTVSAVPYTACDEYAEPSSSP